MKNVEYLLMVDFDGSKEELSFILSLEEIEEDGLAPLLDSAIENYMQDSMCNCSFSEFQNHCDCMDGYDGYEIMERNLKQEENQVIYIATPYRADTKEQFEKQLAYTKELARKQVMDGNEVIVVHLYYTQFLDDNSPQERKLGMESSKKLIKVCDKVLVGAKHGISQGVQAEIDYAKENGIRVEFIDEKKYDSLKDKQVDNGLLKKIPIGCD